MQKSEERLWDLWDTMKRNNICMIGIPEGEKKEKGTESIFIAIMAENFLNLGREIDIQIHEAQRTPNRLNPSRATLRHYLNCQKSKAMKNFKSSKTKERSYIKGNPHEIISRFLNRNFSGQKRMGWHSKYWKKEPVNQELYTQWNCPSELKEG